MRSLIIASFVAGLLICTTYPAQAEDQTASVHFVKIGVSGNNLFFNAILDKLMHLAGIDYAPIIQPFNRSVWALSKGKIHMMGPYSTTMMGEYALSSGFPIHGIEKIPLAIDRIPMFGIYQGDLNVRQSYRQDPSLSIGTLRQHSVTRFHQSQKVIKAKNIQQLVNLLLAKRVQFIVTSKQTVDEIIRQYGHSKLRTTARPLFFEPIYLYYSARIAPLRQKIQEALEKLPQTSAYQTLWEQFSHETAWQSE